MEPETTDAWNESLRTLSAAPDSHAKLSGLGRFVHRNDAALIACIIDNAIDIPGSDHLMFSSNFPIEKLWTSHAELIKAHRDAVAKHGPTAEADIFWNTAERVYKPV
ncbi:amidohydrolase family protein [Mesorhizobium sp. B2-4-15]|uniref:amidohydrolase family protein n=1 Tax=Mesorhizobium sp. B2-4-15 TaxID=2589934 RepID=UPI001FF02F90|nr:amidohydrolase family protein [Mesorhizobium sp. B2-4-15]